MIITGNVASYQSHYQFISAFVAGFKLCFVAVVMRFFCWSGELIAIHKVIQNLDTGGTIFPVQVASYLVSNYALQRMDGTHG